MLLLYLLIMIINSLIKQSRLSILHSKPIALRSFSYKFKEIDRKWQETWLAKKKEGESDS